MEIRTRSKVEWDERPLRSLLFAPGNHPRRLEKVGSFGADAIVLDLEDAVADAEKEAARGMVRAALPTYLEPPVVFVRVNGIETGRLDEDVRAVVCSDLDGIVVPKVERADTLAAVDELLAATEPERGLTAGHVRVVAIVETALGLVRCDEIALALPPRVVTLAFGAGDFSVDIGVDLTRDAAELAYARARIVVATRAARRPPPIDGPYVDLQDVDGLVADTLRSRQLGFQGRVVVYPPQVEQVNRAYADLPDEEAERARRIVETFAAAEAQGSASIQVDGRFVDYPIYERARHKLRLYEAQHAGSAS